MSKETIRNWTLILSFLCGWGLTIAGFVVPPLGVVDNSIIIIFGQALTYCAVGLGMKDYVDVKMKEVNNNN